jgi:hypothetical protein
MEDQDRKGTVAVGLVGDDGELDLLAIDGDRHHRTLLPGGRKGRQQPGEGKEG